MFKGSVATAAREIPSYCGYFASYYLAKRWYANYVQNVPLDKISYAGCFVSGGFAGFMAWLVSYPQDIIKTKLQLSSNNEFPKYHRFVPDGGFIKCA